MKKIICLIILSIFILSGCSTKVGDEYNVYTDEPMRSYALIVLSKETNISTGDFKFISEKKANWEWDDYFYKFEDSENNEYVVKVYHNDLDYKVMRDEEVIIDTIEDTEREFWE